MLGWDSTHSRDYEEAVVNGYVDNDLDRMQGVIARRKASLKYPTCPVCGEPLEAEHVHKAESGNGTEFNIIVRPR